MHVIVIGNARAQQAPISHISHIWASPHKPPEPWPRSCRQAQAPCPWPSLRDAERLKVAFSWPCFVVLYFPGGQWAVSWNCHWYRACLALLTEMTTWLLPGETKVLTTTSVREVLWAESSRSSMNRKSKHQPHLFSCNRIIISWVFFHKHEAKWEEGVLDYWAEGLYSDHLEWNSIQGSKKKNTPCTDCNWYLYTPVSIQKIPYGRDIPVVPPVIFYPSCSSHTYTSKVSTLLYYTLQ